MLDHVGSLLFVQLFWVSLALVCRHILNTEQKKKKSWSEVRPPYGAPGCVSIQLGFPNLFVCSHCKELASMMAQTSMGR